MAKAVLPAPGPVGARGTQPISSAAACSGSASWPASASSNCAQPSKQLGVTAQPAWSPRDGASAPVSAGRAVLRLPHRPPRRRRRRGPWGEALPEFPALGHWRPGRLRLPAGGGTQSASGTGPRLVSTRDRRQAPAAGRLPSSTSPVSRRGYPSPPVGGRAFSICSRLTGTCSASPLPRPRTFPSSARVSSSGHDGFASSIAAMLSPSC